MQPQHATCNRRTEAEADAEAEAEGTTVWYHGPFSKLGPRGPVSDVGRHILGSRSAYSRR